MVAATGRYSGRQVGGLFLSLFGLTALASTLVLNPWTAALVRGPRAVDSADVLRLYVETAGAVGILHLALGAWVASGRRPLLDGPALASLLLSAALLADRLLLVAFGLPLWVYDTEIAYRNRPGKVMSLAHYGRPADRIRINRYGQHDDDFPLAKPPGELRGLLLGDSITMGDGVTYPETFAAQLEVLLRARGGWASYQMINTGVNGYATFQELAVFRESLVFQPDFVVLGFCMNDVTEPFVQDRDFGGTGFDYHGVLQTHSALMGYLFNETGAGRLLQKVRSRAASREAALREEVYDVGRMARLGRADPHIDEAWSIVLRDLGGVDELARANHLPLVILVFPFTFQLSDPGARDPERILADFARERGIPLIDFTDVFAALVYDDPALLAALRARGHGPAEVEGFYEWKIRRYFRDSDHLTREGHAVVARELFDRLESLGLLRPRPQDAGAAAPGPQAARSRAYTSVSGISSGPEPAARPPSRK